MSELEVFENVFKWAAVIIIGGMSWILKRLIERTDTLEKEQNGMKVNIAKEYISKHDFEKAIAKLDKDNERIEGKIDGIHKILSAAGTKARASK